MMKMKTKQQMKQIPITAKAAFAVRAGLPPPDAIAECDWTHIVPGPIKWHIIPSPLETVVNNDLDAMATVCCVVSARHNMPIVDNPLFTRTKIVPNEHPKLCMARVPTPLAWRTNSPAPKSAFLKSAAP